MKGGEVSLDVSNIPIGNNPKESGHQIPLHPTLFSAGIFGGLSLDVNVTPILHSFSRDLGGGALSLDVCNKLIGNGHHVRLPLLPPYGRDL